MKYLGDLPVDGLELHCNNLQHELYLFTSSYWPQQAKSIKTATEIMIVPFVNGDDCSGHYRKAMIKVYIK